MGFQSLFGESWSYASDSKYVFEPKYFIDLNLNQMIDQIMSYQKDCDMKQFFYTLPKDESDILYRQEILKDLENKELCEELKKFSFRLRDAIKFEEYSALTENKIQKKRYKLDSAVSYCQALKGLAESLTQTASRGFQSLRQYLLEYIKSQQFSQFEQVSSEISEKFSQIRYGIQIERNKITVVFEPSNEDYCQHLNQVFGNEGELKNTFDNPSSSLELTTFEEKILKVLEKKNTKLFQMLSDFDAKYDSFIEPVIIKTNSELTTYLSYKRMIGELMDYGYSFCYPKVTECGKDDFVAREVYDIALALTNCTKEKKVIRNDFAAKKGEQFFVITGPNQGGKTTFARAMGQVVYFSLLGLMAPCDFANIPWFKGILTHFSVEESLETGAGKLKEELIRLRPMMRQSSSQHFVIINELFTTAASYDAYIMGNLVMQHFMKEECMGIYVTHISELAAKNDGVVSMVASLDEYDAHKRTFQIKRADAEGMGYINGIVEKYQLTYDQIKERMSV